MLLMGLPFLLLGVSSAIPLIVFVLVLFVIGEMLWVPTSQAVVAGLAPDDLRGAYMGAFGGTAAMGFALAPFLGLQVRSEVAVTRQCGLRSPASRSWSASRRARVPRRRQASRETPRVCCTCHMRREERDQILKQGVVSAETPRDRREREALAEDIRSAALHGRPLHLRLRNFRPAADGYLAALGGPLPYMVRLREITELTAEPRAAAGRGVERAGGVRARERFLRRRVDGQGSSGGRSTRSTT